MTHKKNKLIGALGVFTLASSITSATAASDGDWAETIGNLGTLYKDKSNPIIQEWKIFGRAHYQWNYSDGDNGGLDFDGNGGELRRFRFGTSVKFLNGFKAGARLNIEKGGFRDTSIGYSSFDELYLSYSRKDVFGLDKAGITYGRVKVSFGGEEHESSKKIKTVERSNINNFYAPNRATGVILTGSKNNVDITAGIYSTDRDRETWAQWTGNKAYYLSAEFEALGGDFTTDFIYVDADTGTDGVFGYDWATSITYETEIGNVDLFTNVTYGDTGNENVYGVVVMPSTYIIPDKLEAVFRYQWAHSNGSAQIRPTSSRGVRPVASRDGVGIAAGDDDHTFYAGLNYYILENHAKVMIGAEYEDLSGPAVDLEATTLWAAFRMYF